MAPATTGDDKLLGTGGNDNIDGLAGNDWILAFDGNDILTGGSGRDALWASYGNDTMIGGTESDTYHVDSYFDSIIEAAGVNEGDHDRVNSYITISLLADFAGQDIEDLRLVSFEFTAPSAIDAVGNALNNWIEGNHAVNTIDGNDGDDTLDGWEGTDTLLGGNGNDLFIVDHASDLLDVIDGGADSNTVKIWFNVNLLTLIGGTATPLNWVNIQNITLGGTATLSATGDNNANILTGNDAANKLTGLGGNDTLDGGKGADSMAGGLGDDVFIVDNTTDKVGDLAGQGTDTVMSKVTYVLPTSGATSEVENLTLTETAAINGTGNALANVITGNISSNKLLGLAGADTIIGDGGGDTLDGGAGIDTLTGNDGNDVYFIDTTLDVVTEAAGEGTDKINATLIAGAIYVLPAEVENLTLLGTVGGQNITGNVLNNTLVGNTANNTLAGLAGLDSINGGGGNDVLSGGDDNDTIDGGTGNDTMDGGLGDDTFMVDSATDIIIEGVGEGKDLVKATKSYSLVGSPNADDLTLLGAATVGIGNDLVNTITGTGGKNTLSGGLGNDSLLGGGGDDILNGGGDDDLLDGQVGKDTMTGGTGNDLYKVDNAGDIVIEAAGEGTDTVESSLNYTLGANLENLNLVAGTTGIGNSLDNVMTGNGAKNVLSGLAGNDTINAGAGNDTIDGGTGDDTMNGGLGDDTYYVDGLLDVIIEGAAEGTEDTVFSSVTYALTAGAAEIENLTLTGTATISGTGNDYDNTITGNVAINTLAGGVGDDGYVVFGQEDLIVEAIGEGNDTIYSYVTYDLMNPNAIGAEIENLVLLNPALGFGGGGTIDGYGTNGNDTLTGNDFDNVLYGRQGDDTFIESLGNDEYIELNGEGNDTIESKYTYTLASNLDGLHEVENLTLTGLVAINGTGNELDNVITGNTANNTLDGGTGNDTLIGGTGNDTYIVDDAVLDVVTENPGAGIDTVMSSATYSLFANAANTENLTLTGSANIDGTGNDVANTITGNGAINTLAGMDGNDVYIIRNGAERIIEAVGEGTDIVRTAISFNMNFVANSDEVEQIIALGEDDINITGNDFDNTITGNKGDNILNGAGGNDTLDAGDGVDTLIGGLGNDTFIVDSLSGIALFDAPGGGNDTIKIKASYSLVGLPASLELENITLDGTGAFNATGNAVTNILIGNSAKNTLDGGAGADTMDGGGGSDVMFVDNVNDFIDEKPGAGIDTVFSSVSFDFSTNGVEADNLTLTGTANLNATGNALDNTLTGNTGINVLTGGAGKDTYVIQNAGDSVVEGASIPLERDIILSSVTHTMEADVEDMTLTGTLAINGTGNTMDNTILGNSAVNILTGMDGDDVLGATSTDTLDGGNGSDTGLTNFTTNLVTLTLSGLWTSVENITLSGTALIHAFGDAGVNTITGNTAANTLDGGGGTDTLIGKGGNDIYIVNDSSVVIDEVTEGGGKDLVKSTVSYTLSTNVDDLTLLGTANIDGTGNTGANTIIGNSGNNILNGGLGADSLAGGLGNDTYVVDTASDKLTDTGGVELVISTTTWTLATGFENLTLSGGAIDINGTGNSAINTITGNAGKNTIDGGTGADRMIGGGDDDTYIIDTLGDIIIEGAGGGTHDLIMSKLTYSLAAIAEVEDLTLTGTASIHGTGNALDNIITGNSASNTLMGGAGDDTLIGGEGKDFLYGGPGSDTFIFDINSFKAIDVIKDFEAGIDVIVYPGNVDALYDVNEEFVDYRTQANGDEWIYVDVDGVRGTQFTFQLIAIIDYP